MKYFSKVFVLIASVFECYAFNPYLETLSMKQGSSHIHKLKNILKDAPLCRDKTVQIDSIFLNVYEFKEVGFKRNSNAILLKLKDKVRDLYYVDDNNVFKLSDDTKIIASSIRNILLYEMDPDREINGIVFNSQKGNTSIDDLYKK